MCVHAGLKEETKEKQLAPAIYKQKYLEPAIAAMQYVCWLQVWSDSIIWPVSVRSGIFTTQMVTKGKYRKPELANN